MSIMQAYSKVSYNTNAQSLVVDWANDIYEIGQLRPVPGVEVSEMRIEMAGNDPVVEYRPYDVFVWTDGNELFAEHKFKDEYWEFERNALEQGIVI